MDLTMKKDKIQSKIQMIVGKNMSYDHEKFPSSYKFVYDGVEELIKGDRLDLAKELTGLDKIRENADAPTIAELFNLLDAKIDTATEEVDEVKDEEAVEKNNTKTEKTSTGKKKIKIEGEKSVVKDKLGLGVRTDAIKEIDTIVKAYKKNGIKSNASLVVEKALETVFNSETGKYNLEVQPKADLKTTTFSVDKKYIDALDDLAETTNVSKSELFDMLIRLGLNNLYE